MLPRSLRIGSFAVAALAAGGTASAQDKAKVFFRSVETYDGSEKGEKGEAFLVENVNLRPNQTQSAFLFVYNAGAAFTADVVLSEKIGDKFLDIATAAAVSFEANRSQPVRLASLKAAKPTAAPAAGAAPAVDLGTALKFKQKSNFFLTFRKKDAPPVPVEVNGVVKIDDLAAKISVEADKLAAASNGDLAARKLTVRVKYTVDPSSLSRSAVPVSLDLRTDANPGIDLESLKLATGNLKAEVESVKDAQAELVVDGLKFDAKRQGADFFVFAVSIDGVTTKFFKTGFETGAEVKELDPAEQKAIATVRATPDLTVPGKPVLLRLEAPFVDLNTLKLNVKYAGGEPKPVRTFDGIRREAVYAKFGDENGGIAFTAEVADHAYEFPTAAVNGKVTFGIDGTKALKVVTIDRTPPVVTEPKTATDKLFAGEAVTLTATATDDLTEVTGGLFWIGEEPGADGKPVGTGKVYKAKSADGGKTWTATADLPATRGRYDIGFRAGNAVGLTGSKVKEAVFVDEKPAEKKEKEKTTGTIEGVVKWSTLPQPNVVVELRDATGKTLLNTTKTNDKGEFKFTELKPGEYKLFAEKTYDRSELKAVSVKAGETTKGDDAAVSIKRIVGPRP